MKVIVDANILFSGMLNTNGKIGDLILNSDNILNFIAAEYMLAEVENYFPKIEKITGKKTYEVEQIFHFLIKNMETISMDNLTPNDIWVESFKILEDIDPKDTPYLALSTYLDTKIWSGDKKFENGLKKKELNRIITTNELYEHREKSKGKNIL